MLNRLRAYVDPKPALAGCEHSLNDEEQKQRWIRVPSRGETLR